MAERGNDSESTGEDAASASSIDGPQLDEAMDPMGLGGVGGGLFGGDPAGSGGSLLTGGPDTTAQEDQAFWDRTKSFRQAHNLHTFDFWSPMLKSIAKGRKDLTALGLKFDKNNKVTPQSLLTFMQDEDQATKNLTNVLENVLKDYEDKTPEEKSIVVDALIHSMVNSWDGVNVTDFPYGMISVDINFSHELNQVVRDAVLGVPGLFGKKGWKDDQGLPRTHETFDVYGIDEEDEDKTPDIRVQESYKSIMGLKEDEEDSVKEEDKNAMISNYLDVQQVASVAPPPTVVDDPTTIESLQAYEDNPPLSTQEIFDDIENMLNQPTIQQAPPPTGQTPVGQPPAGMLSQTTVTQPQGLISTAQNVNVPTNTEADLVGLNLSYDFNTNPTFGANITA